MIGNFVLYKVGHTRQSFGDFCFLIKPPITVHHLIAHHSTCMYVRTYMYVVRREQEISC